MPEDKVKQSLFDKKEFYETLTRNIRWASIAFVGLTYPISSPYITIIYPLIALAITYNLLRYWQKFLEIKPLGSYISMNFADNLFSLSLIYFSGGLSSPYYLFLLLMIITATYWYGLVGLGIIGVFNVIILTVLALHEVPSEYTLHGWVKLASVAFFIFATGFMVERLTHAERRERVGTEQANEEIETEKQRLLALVNSIGTGVVAIDPKGKVMMYNGAAIELLNTNEDMTNKSLDEFLHLGDAEEKLYTIIDVVSKAKGVQHRDDLLSISSDGSKMNLDMTISPIHSIGDKKEQGFILVLRDITREKSLEEVKDEFVSVTSHELRTPLAIAEGSISTVIAMMKKGDVDPKIAEMLNTSHENIVFLGSLVADLSTLARAERGVLEVDLAMVNPVELLKQLQTNYAEEAKKANLDLKVQTSGDLKPLLTSQSHVQEILQNFITNSLKYTKEGSITLIAEPSKWFKEGVRFGVADTGIGLSLTDKKRVFDKFFRSEDFRTRESSGTGLGLYITKKLAERLSGHITLQSQLNKGSTFFIDIPAVSDKKEDRNKVVEAQVDDFVSQL